MSIQSLINIKKAVSNLNSNSVREKAEQRLLVGLHAANPESYSRMESFLLTGLSPARRHDSASLIVRAPQMGSHAAIDVNIYDEGVIAPAKGLIYRPDRPEALVNLALSRYPDFAMPLSRSFKPFRQPYVDKVIATSARENTLFSLATALPDVIPNLIELPWAVAEFASDTAFLTMNQIRMAFMLAGANDREVGYREQKSEIAAVIGSAFGWRAIARQIVGKVPFGGGLIGKAAIAYAGTKVLGLSLDRFYSVGYAYAREERDALYSDAYHQGKRIALKLLGLLRPDIANRFTINETKAAPAGARAAGSQGRP